MAIPTSSSPRSATPQTAGPHPVNRDRSPNYPQINIAQAIDRTRKIYQQASRHSVQDTNAAEFLGYTSLNGTSKAVLSSLKKYGLLVKAADGSKVSNDAFDIFELPEDSQERLAAIRRCALRPAAFKTLYDSYSAKLPADSIVRHSLMSKQSYHSEGANQLIKVYKETLEYLDKTGINMAIAVPEAVQPTNPNPAVDGKNQSAGVPVQARHESSPPEKPSADTQQFRFRIAPDCTAEVIFVGQVTQEAIYKLIRHLELTQEEYPPSQLAYRENEGKAEAVSSADADEDAGIIGIDEEDEDEAQKHNTFQA